LGPKAGSILRPRCRIDPTQCREQLCTCERRHPAERPHARDGSFWGAPKKDSFSERPSRSADARTPFFRKIRSKHIPSEVRAFDAPARSVHHESSHSNLRIVSRGKRNEPRVVSVLFVSSERSGFAGDLHTGKKSIATTVVKGLVCGAAFHGVKHHLGNFIGSRCFDTTAQHLGLFGGLPNGLVALFDFAHDVRL